jgi:hypothetical protein
MDDRMNTVEEFLKRYERPPCFGKFKRESKDCRDCSDSLKCKDVSKNK